MNRLRYTTFWGWWGLALVLLGLAAPSGPAGAQPSVAYRQYTAEDGLPTNLTKAVFQDRSGRLWIGTDNGLVQFDGSEFETYRNALRSPLVKDVYPGPDGRLLVATDRGIHELSQRRDSVSFSLLVAGQDTRTDSTIRYPKAVYRDRQQRLWIGEWDAISRYEDGTLTRYVPEPGLERWSDRFMRSFLFAEPADGPLVATAQRGYVFAFDSTADRFRRLSLPNRPADFHVNALIPNPEGPGLLLGTDHGLYRLEVGASYRVRRWEKLNDLRVISSLCPGPDGGLLIGTWEKGLYRASGLDADPAPYGDLPFVVIQDIMTTQNDAIILASDTGLGVIPHAFFRPVLPPTEKGNRYIRNVVPGPDGTIWVSRNEDIFSVVRAGESFRSRPYPLLDRKGDVWGLSPTDEGLWIGFQDGHLEYVKDDRRRRIFLPDSESQQLIRSIVPDGRGGVWVLKDGIDGAVHVNASFEASHYGRERGPSGRLYALHRTADDTLYAGGEGKDGYLYRFDPGRDRFVNESVPLPDAVSSPLRVEDLADGPEGALWLATSQGLLRYQDGRLTALGALQPYEVESISAVAVTEERLVWIGTNRGLFAYDPETGSLRRFNRQTGLPSPTVLPRCLRLDDQGRLWVGTAEGLAHLNDVPLAPARTPKPVVTKLWADNQLFRARPESALRLPYNSTLEIRYAAPIFVQDGTVYRHRIRGEGASWSPISTGSPLVLHQLSGGDYTLELKAQQPGFGWSPPTRVHFSVQPPWYLRWWALLLGGLILLGLFGLLGLVYRHRRAQREAERALYRSRKQYESVVENVEEAIFQLDREGRWSFLNPAWTDITGYAVDHSLDRPYDAFVHPGDRDALADTIDPLLEGEQERGRCQVRFEEPEGHTHWVEVRAQLLREEDGTFTGITGLLVDVHERKQYEEKLIEARERAEEMNRLKSVFLANMGHELRTPLTSILGFGRSLKDELPEPYRDLMQPILTSGQRLKRTFDSVLSLAQIEGDAVQLEQEPEAVGSLVDETLSFFRSRAEQENIDLRLETPAEPVRAALDSRAFDRVLSNLLSNALKFTEEGAVVVRVRRTEGQVVVEVEDTGVGIGEEFLPEVFDEFKQESEGLTRSYEGSGLGLTIAKRLVEQMGGTIAIDSEKGVGTTVTLRFEAVEQSASVLLGGA
jgi:PAS domain S-box-containing protein